MRSSTRHPVAALHPKPPSADQHAHDADEETRRPRGPAIIVLALLGASACDEYVGCAPVLTTDDGQLEFHDQAVTVGACQRLREPAPLLEGTLWCPAVQCGSDVDGCEDDDGEKISDEAVAACFDATVDGPVVEESSCLRMLAPGDASWSFAAKPCAAADSGYVPADDGYAWSVVAGSEVTAHLQAPGDAFALRSLVDDRGAPLPADDTLAPGDIAHVVADTAVGFAVVLRHPDHEASVGWNPTNWDLVVQPIEGPAPDAVLEDLGLLTVTMQAGASASVSVVARPEAGLSQTIDVGVVSGVAPSDLASLKVVVGYAEAPEDSGLAHGPVAGARAVVKSAAGEPVYGADVSWSVTEGSVPLWREESAAWTSDYVALAERDGAACHDPPKKSRQYVATIVAELAALSDQSTVRWTEIPPEDGPLGSLGDLFDDPPDRSDRCAGPGFPEQQGCGCTTKKTSTPATAGMLALFAIGLMRRRFRRRRTRR